MRWWSGGVAPGSPGGMVRILQVPKQGTAVGVTFRTAHDGNLDSQGLELRALVISGAGRYGLLDHQPPAPGPGDLLLAPLAVGLCATDLELLDGSMVYLRDGRTRLPLVPGHEWVATVVDPGTPGTGFAVGDVVVGECSIGCGDCPVCASGAYN